MIDKRIVNYVNKLVNELHLVDYLGIIVYGSYVGGRNNLLSDLDVMIIKDNYPTQDCGSIIVENVRIEYFIQDLNVLYELIKKEIENNDPSHLTKFATCEILYDTDSKIEEFISYAKELYQTKVKSSFDDNDKFAIFSINNRMEDLESLIEDEIFYAVYYITLERIRTLYSKVNGIIDLPVMKIEKIYKDKDFAKKYISSTSHSLPNQEFIDLYLECIKLDNKDKMLHNLKRLYNYSFNNLDFDPKYFCLKFKKKSPFRV